MTSQCSHDAQRRGRRACMRTGVRAIVGPAGARVRVPALRELGAQVAALGVARRREDRPLRRAPSALVNNCCES